VSATFLSRTPSRQTFAVCLGDIDSLDSAAGVGQLPIKALSKP